MIKTDIDLNHENTILRNCVNTLLDCAVSFMQDGPFEPKEAFDRVDKMYDLANETLEAVG